MWEHKDANFYNRSMKLWFQNNGAEMYSSHDGGKSVVAERFTRILKSKI